MAKRTYDKLRAEIIKTLAKNSPLTYAQLERKIKTNPDTLRTHCQDLALFSIIKITKKAKHKLNGRPYFLLELTNQGRKILKKIIN